MIRLISRQRGGLAALKLTKLFRINDFPAAKDSGKVVIIIIYCYLIILLLVPPNLVTLTPMNGFAHELFPRHDRALAPCFLS